MKAIVGFLLILSVSVTLAEILSAAVNTTDSISSAPVGSLSEPETSKIVTVLEPAPAVAPVAREHDRQKYDAAASEFSYPTSTCNGHARGYHGDAVHGCQIFHVCQDDGRLETFDCPPYTKFNNHLLVCDWPYKVDANCDPVYKDKDYPILNHGYGHPYPIAKNYLPGFMSLYPVTKVAFSAAVDTADKPVSSVIDPADKAYAKTYGSRLFSSYGPEKKTIEAYQRYSQGKPRAVYPGYRIKNSPYKRKTVYPSHKSYGEENPAVHQFGYKPLSPEGFPIGKASYAAYGDEKTPSYSGYPVEKPSSGKMPYRSEKISYDAEKVSYHEQPYEKSAYPSPVQTAQKSLYDVYPLEKPVYNPEYNPNEKPSSKSYQPQKPHRENPGEKSSYGVYSSPKKPVYPLENLDNGYSTEKYPVRKSYQRPSQKLPHHVYPSKEPAYNDHVLKGSSYSTGDKRKYERLYPTVAAYSRFRRN